MDELKETYIAEWYGEGGWPLLGAKTIKASPETVREVLGPQLCELLTKQEIDLSERELGSFAALGLIEPGLFSGDPILRRADKNDRLPYQLHTNRELEMMLKGVKPLSVFLMWSGGEALLERIERAFRSSVLAQDLVFRHCCWLPGNGSSKRYSLGLYIAKSSEEWRIDAYILMQICRYSTGWSDGFELMEGRLLGYAEWENEVHLRQFKDTASD